MNRFHGLLGYSSNSPDLILQWSQPKPFPKNGQVPQFHQVPVSVTQEEIVHVPRVVYQHRHHHAEVEQVVDLHVPHHIEETVSVPKVNWAGEAIFGAMGERWLSFLGGTIGIVAWMFFFFFFFSGTMDYGLDIFVLGGL